MIGGIKVVRYSLLAVTYPQKPQEHLLGSSASAIATVTGGSLSVSKERFSLLSPRNSPLLYTEVGVTGQTRLFDRRGHSQLPIATCTQISRYYFAHYAVGTRQTSFTERQKHILRVQQALLVCSDSQGSLQRSGVGSQMAQPIGSAQ